LFIYGKNKEEAVEKNNLKDLFPDLLVIEN